MPPLRQNLRRQEALAEVLPADLLSVGLPGTHTRTPTCSGKIFARAGKGSNVMNPRREYHQKYYRDHFKEIAERKAWRQKYDLDYRLKAILRTIVSRCNNPGHTSYRWYGGKGIQNFLTLDDLKMLWHRDKATQMRKPSVDRLNSDGHYELDNVRFIELSQNLKETWRRSRTVIIRGKTIRWQPTAEEIIREATGG